MEAMLEEVQQVLMEAKVVQNNMVILMVPSGVQVDLMKIMDKVI
jgi:putative effector of murein hydrolase LrgA (UPF0299 family)